MEAYMLWHCGVCHQDFGTRRAAERHCSQLVEREMDPMEGRIPIIRKKVPEPFDENVYGDGRRVTA